MQTEEQKLQAEKAARELGFKSVADAQAILIAQQDLFVWVALVKSVHAVNLTLAHKVRFVWMELVEMAAAVSQIQIRLF